MHPQYTLADVVRLYSHLDLSNPEGCWTWTGRRLPHGYGQVSLCGSPTYAHRALWLVTYGPIPPGMLVCHQCDNPPCCRPDHLFLGDKRANGIDAVLKGRHPHAVVTAGGVQEMRHRYAAGGITAAALGREYGLAPTQAKRILRGKSWAHLSPASEESASPLT